MNAGLFDNGVFLSRLGRFLHLFSGMVVEPLKKLSRISGKGLELS